MTKKKPSSKTPSKEPKIKANKADQKRVKPVELSEVSALRQGLIVYVFAMAVIVAIGIYLYQRADTLSRQYDKIIEQQGESQNKNSK